VSAGNSVSGLVFASLCNGSALRAVTVNRFDSSGIEFQSNNNVLDRCFVGLGADGITTYPLPGGQAIGIRITGAGNRIGGDRTQSTGSNYITGNTSSQIEIDSAAATGNRIVGNDIGSLVDDTVVPGGVDVRGIRIIGGATATLIGGTTFEEKNSISANYAGIEVNEQAGDTVITHNDIEFCGIGVLILNSSGNRVGGQTSGTDQLEGNIFDRNELGVLVDAGSDARPRDIYPSLADNTSGATLRGRSFAVQTSGSNHIYGNIFMVLEKTQLPEGTTTGVVVGDAEDTSIGLEGSGGYRNFIADQTEAGIVVRKEAVRTSIAANIIGLQADDTPRPNRLGIRLAGNGTEVRNNLISGNIDFGVVIDRLAAGDAFPMDNVVRSNFIGTNSAGTAAVANSGPGVSIEGNQNEISYNLVSGNAGVGISVLGNTNTVFGNKIGTNHLLGDTAIGNTEGGIAIFGSSNFIRSNLISGNLGGIALQRHPDRPDLSPTGNIIDDNNIGVNAALTAAVPYASGGIALLNATNNQLTRNIVAGNGTVGIGIAQGSTGNTLAFNYVGVNRAGVAIPNDGPGIYIKESAGNFIGNSLVSPFRVNCF